MKSMKLLFLIFSILFLSGCEEKRDLKGVCETRVRIADSASLKYICTNNKLTVIEVRQPFFGSAETNIISYGEYCSCDENIKVKNDD